MVNYLIVTVITLLLLFAVKFILEAVVIYIPAKKKPASVLDQLNADPKFRELRDLMTAVRNLNENATDQDMIPEGTGEFGYDVTNPIPVNTIIGNDVYLSRLRTHEGVKVGYVRQGSTRAPNMKNPVDVYDILDGEKKIATLYISPYHKKNSALAPKGFTLAQMP